MKKNYLFQTGSKACVALLLFVLSMQSAVAQCTNTRATSGAYTHENWVDKGTPGTGTGCLTLGANNTFSAEWNNIYNYLGRRGLAYDETRHHSDIGWITANYTVDYRPNCGRMGSNSYTGVYGWAVDTSKSSPNDLVEWYIIEGWCNYNPSVGNDIIDTVVINGAEYDIVRAFRDDKPSIKNGTADDFYQYFSVRKNSDTNGVAKVLSGWIDVSGHFEAWAKAGLPMGNLNEVSMLVEGYGHGNSPDDSSDPTGEGSANFTQLNINVDTGAYVRFKQETYTISTAPPTDLNSSLVTLEFNQPGMPPLPGGAFPDIEVVSNSANLNVSGNGATTHYVSSTIPGTYQIRLIGPSGAVWDTANVTVNPSTVFPHASPYTFRALGTTGGEKLQVTVNGVAVNSGHTLSTDYKLYSGTLVGPGQVGIKFINDASGRDARVDYLLIEGSQFQAEQMANNSAAYGNGSCGSVGYSEWMHCNGTINFGYYNASHVITIRARGTAGGEHINLLIDGEPVNDGLWLEAGYKEYKLNVFGNGDINVEFDNDGGQKDVLIDWIKVDNQGRRYAEYMEYNTGAYANGQCGGGSYTKSLHCNGVIGFGDIDDNY